VRAWAVCGRGGGRMGRQPKPVKRGERFGRLTVTRYLGMVRGHGTCRCRCDCGGTWEGPAFRLRSGVTRSCGCLGREHLRAVAASLPGRWAATNADRLARILRLRRAGLTLRQIAEIDGSSYQNVHQLLKKHFGAAPKEEGERPPKRDQGEGQKKGRGNK